MPNKGKPDALEQDLATYKSGTRFPKEIKIHLFGKWMEAQEIFCAGILSAQTSLYLSLVFLPPCFLLK